MLPPSEIVDSMWSSAAVRQSRSRLTRAWPDRRLSLLSLRRPLSTAALDAGAEGSVGHYVGQPNTKFTSTLQYFHPQVHDLPAIMPTFRLMDDEGVPLPGAVLPDLSKEACVSMMETMIRVSEFDRVFYDAQRQGRLSFYFTNRGEEAQAVGSAAALQDNDWVWPQYRELGASFWRGYSFEDCANQCCHNELDATKGRQVRRVAGV